MADDRISYVRLVSLFVPLSLLLMAGQKITAKNSGLKPTVDDSKGTLKGIGNLSVPNESDASEEESEDGENDGVDEEGLEKLMNALGEDGLDEFDLAQLRMLTGSAAGEEDDSEEEGRSNDDEEDNADATHASTDEEEQEDEGKSKEEEEIALDDEDVDSVDEDAIPRRKVEIDNKVGPLSLFACQLILFYG